MILGELGVVFLSRAQSSGSLAEARWSEIATDMSGAWRDNWFRKPWLTRLVSAPHGLKPSKSLAEIITISQGNVKVPKSCKKKQAQICKYFPSVSVRSATDLLTKASYIAKSKGTWENNTKVGNCGSPLTSQLFPESEMVPRLSKAKDFLQSPSITL